MPLSILLGTEALSGQLVSRATPFPSLSFMPRAAGLDDLGAQGPFPFSKDKAAGADESIRESWDRPFLWGRPASTHSAAILPPPWASVSLSVIPGVVSPTPGPSPAVPSCTCEILRAEAGRRDGPSFPAASPCPPGSPQSLPLPRLPGTSLQLQAW